MSRDLTGLAMAPRRSSGGTTTIVLLALTLALAAFVGRDRIAALAMKDVAGSLGRPVSGVVIDAETQLPVAGARVTSSNGTGTPILPRQWSDETRTNAHGEFTVRAASDDEADASDIVVTAPGYQDTYATARFGERMMIQLNRRAGG